MSDSTNPISEQAVDDLIREVEEGNISQQLDELLRIPDDGSYKVTFTMKKGHADPHKNKQLCYDRAFPSEIDRDEVVEKVRSIDLEIGASVVVKVDVDENSYEILDMEGENQ